MFESAIEAAASAARAWTPDRAEATGRRCCALCFERYRVLVLDGPLHDLPHAVAHAAVAAVDDLVAVRVVDLRERLEHDDGTVPLSGGHPREDLDRRLRGATGALTTIALEEFGTAAPLLAELRTRDIEPALAATLQRDRMDDVPWSWQ